MANFVYDSIKRLLFSGQINVLTDDISVILMSGSYMSSSATPAVSHQKYSDVSLHELVNGGGYGRKGIPLTSPTMSTGASNTLSFDADSITWPSSTITASGAIIYVSGAQGPLVDPLLCYVDFGSNQTSSNGDFTIEWNANGILRLSNG